MNRTTFQKRQREMQRLEKQRLKAERRAQKKLARNAEDGARSPDRNWGDPQCANPGICFLNPLNLARQHLFLRRLCSLPGVAIEVKQRFSHHFMAMASCTYSKTWDTTTDFKAVAANICSE